jgi:hypothetical protein
MVKCLKEQRVKETQSKDVCRKHTESVASTHDEIIRDAIRWAESLGYAVPEHHFGSRKGPDAVFENYTAQKVILEVVTGTRFEDFFGSLRIKNALVKLGKYELTRPDMLGLILVADRVNRVKDYGTKAGLPAEIFEPKKERKVFPLITRDFDKVFPILLVSLLGTIAESHA